MKQRREGAKMTGHAISRRAALGAASVGVLGLLMREASGQEEASEEVIRANQEKLKRMSDEAEKQGGEEAYQRMLERTPEMRAFYEGVGPNATMEERMAAVQKYRRQQNMSRFQGQFGLSDADWAVVQPRFEKVYLLRTPPAYFPPEDTSASAVALRLARELGILINNQDATPEEIKVKLTALRSAKEQVRRELANARRELRKVLTVRQEAMLVLSDLMD